MFVDHFRIKISVADITSGGTFANFRAITSHSCGTYQMPFGNLTRL